MYRTSEEIIPTSAEVFLQIARNKKEENYRKIEEKSKTDMKKIFTHCLKKVTSAAKNGEYWMYYKYSPSIIDMLLFWRTPIWNATSAELLKSKLHEIGFECDVRSNDLYISWSK